MIFLLLFSTLLRIKQCLEEKFILKTDFYSDKDCKSSLSEIDFERLKYDCNSEYFDNCVFYYDGLWYKETCVKDFPKEPKTPGSESF